MPRVQFPNEMISAGAARTQGLITRKVILSVYKYKVVQRRHGTSSLSSAHGEGLDQSCAAVCLANDGNSLSLLRWRSFLDITPNLNLKDVVMLVWGEG